MDNAPISTALWALHPRYLDAMQRREALPGVLSRLVAGRPTGRSLPAAAPERAGTVLIVPVVGILAPRGMYGSVTPYEGIADCVREGAADKTVTSIILAIRSPGGTVWGCEEAGDAIFAARGVKPVVAVADPCCFSAAYWLAAQAGKFYVTTSGEVGSVGVRSGHTDMSGFQNKVGMKTTLIASSADKIAAHPYAPLSEEDRAEIQSGVDAANRRFMLALARGRRMRPIDVPRTHGSGRTFSAQRAMARGAIDGVATLRDVVARQGSSLVRLALMRRQAALQELAATI